MIMPIRLKWLAMLASATLLLVGCEIDLGFPTGQPISFTVPNQARLFYETTRSASVSTAGNLAVVGVPTESDRSDPNMHSVGAAYIYERINDVWTLKMRLAPPLRTRGLAFGTSVAVHGDHIVIGAPNTSSPNPIAKHGYVYFYEPETVIIRLAHGVYTFKGWQLARTFYAGDVGIIPTTATPDQFAPRFGTSVSVFGDFAIAGAPGYGRPDQSPLSLQLGAVAMFSFSDSGGWGHDTTITMQDNRLGFSSAAQRNANFGFSVSMGNTIAAVGAPNASMTDASGNVIGEFIGMAAVLERKPTVSGHEWTCCTILRPETPHNANTFGVSVAVQKGGEPEYVNHVAVGEPYRHRPGTQLPIGHASIFAITLGGGAGGLPTGQLLRSFGPPDDIDNGLFGTSVKLQYPKILIAGKRATEALPPYTLFYRHWLFGWLSSNIVLPAPDNTVLFSSGMSMDWPEVLVGAKRQTGMDGTFRLYESIVFRFRHWKLCSTIPWISYCRSF